MVIGGPGAGTTTTLAAAALAVTRGRGVDAPHVHVIDLDSGGLLPLADLPSAGTIVAPTDGVRRNRLVRWLDDEVARRRADDRKADHEPPALLVLVDDLGGLARAHDPVREAAIHDRFARIWADGPAVGVTVALSLRRAADLPPSLVATAGRVLIHRCADQSDGLRFGVKTPTDRFPPGRAVRADDGAVLQVVRDQESIVAAVGLRRDDPSPATAPHDVGELRAEITWTEAAPSVEHSHGRVLVRVAIRDRDLCPAELSLHSGEHAVILGPPRSGRTTTLATIARAAGDEVLIVGEELAGRLGAHATAPADLAALVDEGGGRLVLVDDALEIDDPAGGLARLISTPRPGLHFVVSARADRYRSSYGHWAADIKSSRTGLLLRPDPIDGDLLGHQFAARFALDALPGRGVMVSEGTAEVVQVALPE